MFYVHVYVWGVSCIKLQKQRSAGNTLCIYTSLSLVDYMHCSPADAFAGFGRAFNKQCRGPPAVAVQGSRPAQ